MFFFFYWPGVKKGRGGERLAVALRMKKAFWRLEKLYVHLLRKLLEIYVFIYCRAKINLMSCLHGKLSQPFTWKSVLPWPISQHTGSIWGSFTLVGNLFELLRLPGPFSVLQHLAEIFFTQCTTLSCHTSSFLMAETHEA